MPESSWIAPNPPPVTLENPQFQLNSYLDTLDPSSFEEDTPAAGGASNKTKILQDEILNVTEFLYGNNTLMAALALLDSSTAAIPSIVKISSPRTCGLTRSVHVVHSSSKGRALGEDSSSYLCFTQANNGVDYCSCRSFLEKVSKSSKSTKDVTLCKHLLALKLAPYLKVDFLETHLASHQDFSKLILERTLPASGIAPRGSNGIPYSGI
ncbi:unnamed protein product [Cylindrotheca closterium]|uniref:SWIM-type domain-containing protein n=1 Tax=Cylindrotheca closterium TaxID=2856 RepID=A0AAD2CFW5_9STRA|nr:unnamed protein product [Cylindrotheca closterium]